MAIRSEPAEDSTTADSATADSGSARPRQPGLFTGALKLDIRPGTGSGMRWFFSGIWLIYLIQPVANLFGHRHGVLWIAGGVAITVTFAGLYVPVVANQFKWPRFARYGFAALVLLTILACAVYGRDWTPLWIYISAAGAVLLGSLPSRGQAFLGVLGVVAGYSICCWFTHLDLSDYLAVLLPVLLVGLAMIGFRWQITLVRELNQARDTVAMLAASEERLRLARDMHDLTGQSLSMITLKAELAAKRLNRMDPSAERDAVLTEIGDIGRVSRQTLHDIREAVSGYRRPTLAIEVITARNALEAAGIFLGDDPSLTLRSGEFDPDAEAALAWCLREAVTNVVRHSGARGCRVRLTTRDDEISLEVTDDGRGFSGACSLDGTPDDAEQGSGLHGMSERLSAVGGRLSLSPAGPAHPSRNGPSRDGSGFRLTATVPQRPAGPPGHNGQP